MKQSEIRSKISSLVEVRNNAQKEIDKVKATCQHPDLLDRTTIGDPEVRHFCPDCHAMWYD